MKICGLSGHQRNMMECNSKRSHRTPYLTSSWCRLIKVIPSVQREAMFLKCGTMSQNRCCPIDSRASKHSRLANGFQPREQIRKILVKARITKVSAKRQYEAASKHLRRVTSTGQTSAWEEFVPYHRMQSLPRFHQLALCPIQTRAVCKSAGGGRHF